MHPITSFCIQTTIGRRSTPTRTVLFLETSIQTIDFPIGERPSNFRRDGTAFPEAATSIGVETVAGRFTKRENSGVSPAVRIGPPEEKPKKP